jgi:hypothetical protein
MKLEFAPWLDDPDPPDLMTDAEIEKPAKGVRRLLARAAEISPKTGQVAYVELLWPIANAVL